MLLRHSFVVRRSFFVAACLLFLAGTVSAQTARPDQRKDPWEATDDDRISRRLAVAPEDLGKIRGDQHPELFLRHELLNQLLQEAFNRDAERSAAFRAGVEASRVAAGLPADFWNQLSEVCKEVIRYDQRHSVLAAKIDQAAPKERGSLFVAIRELEKEGSKLCGARATALARLSERFGSRMDRFLYETVAPTMSVAYSVTSPDEYRRSLEYAVGGCK